MLHVTFFKVMGIYERNNCAREKFIRGWGRNQMLQCRGIIVWFPHHNNKKYPKWTSDSVVFSCRSRLLLHSRHRESKNKRHPTCLFILWNICGKQENDKHPCSKSNIFDLWNFRNIIYTFDRAEFRFEQNPNQWLRTEDIWMAPQSHSAPHLNLGHVQSAV